MTETVLFFERDFFQVVTVEPFAEGQTLLAVTWTVQQLVSDLEFAAVAVSWA